MGLCGCSRVRHVLEVTRTLAQNSAPVNISDKSSIVVIDQLENPAFAPL